MAIVTYCLLSLHVGAFHCIVFNRGLLLNIMKKCRENLKFTNGNLIKFSSLRLFSVLKALPSNLTIKLDSTLKKLANYDPK